MDSKKQFFGPLPLYFGESRWWSLDTMISFVMNKNGGNMNFFTVSNWGIPIYNLGDIILFVFFTTSLHLELVLLSIFSHFPFQTLTSVIHPQCPQNHNPDPFHIAIHTPETLAPLIPTLFVPFLTHLKFPFERHKEINSIFKTQILVRCWFQFK